MPVIHYLGPVGTFSEQAAKMLCGDMIAMMPEQTSGDCSLIPQPTLGRAINAIDDPDTFAVVPYYNLIEGLIQETPDLIVEHKLKVLAARQIPIRFAIGGFVLGTTDSVPKADVPVFSHPKALAQCSAFLQEHFPTATFHETTSTSKSVRHVLDNRHGLAIAQRETLENLGVPILHDDIGNRQYARQNYTEFLLVGRKDHRLNVTSRTSPESHIRTLIAVIPTVDRFGLLADILGQIAFFEINLLKIHSRPALTDAFGPAPQMFYLETDIAADSKELRLCIETLDMRLAKHGESGYHFQDDTVHKVVHLLGTYTLHVPDDLIHYESRAVKP
jgi:prephenate dehydratase